MSAAPIAEPAEIAQALAAADVRVLLMVLFQITGDRQWLGVRPARDVRLIADEGAGLSPEDQARIRDAALKLLTRGIPAPAIPDPGDELMREMMSVCLGEQVPAEYAPLMREELGFTSRDVAWTREDAKPGSPGARQPTILIIGSGISGMALGARLRRLGLDFTMLERHAEVGGVWLENTYPGAGVDTPNHAYSYSFGSRYAWPTYFCGRDQIHEYLVRFSHELGLRDSIRFETTVTSAEWDEDGSRWHVRVQSAGREETLHADVLVSAIGQFGLPSVPPIEGMDSFAGPIFHSSAWPAGLDVEGKRVAVVGTGASSMQIVPAIVDRVAALDIYQRTPQWARPVERFHEAIGAGTQWLLQHMPFFAGWFRFTMWWRYGDGLLPYLRKDPSWPHPERSLNKTNEKHRLQMVAHIESELSDRPDLVEKCIPTYPPFGKRILLDNGWYQAIKRPGVTLVNAAVTRITKTGIVAAEPDSKERPCDIVVLATGFQVAKLAARLNITGRRGKKLADVWGDDDPSAYLGIAIPDFPNLLLMQGPNTGLGHGGSTVFQAESQARYISGMIARMIEEEIATIDVRPEALDRFVAEVDALHEQLIWTHPGMSTYYRNRKGRVVSVMPFRLVDYWSRTRNVDLAEYRTTRVPA